MYEFKNVCNMDKNVLNERDRCEHDNPTDMKDPNQSNLVPAHVCPNLRGHPAYLRLLRVA